ncbi:MAG: SCO family protein [Pseudomonadota bacterium]
MNRILVICAGLAAFAVGIAVGIVTRSPSTVELESGTLLDPPRAIAPFQLGQSPSVFSNDNLNGHWQLLFFGFTRCPDVCPTTLQLLSNAREALAADFDAADLPKITLVSVDPEFDTQERLNKYTEFFGPGVQGVVGEPDQLQAFSQDLGVLYKKIPLANDDYTMDHSGAVIVIDPEGRWRAVFSPPLRQQTLTDDLQLLIENF